MCITFSLCTPQRAPGQARAHPQHETYREMQVKRNLEPLVGQTFFGDFLVLHKKKKTTDRQSFTNTLEIASLPITIVQFIEVSSEYGANVSMNVGLDVFLLVIEFDNTHRGSLLCFVSAWGRSVNVFARVLDDKLHEFWAFVCGDSKCPDSLQNSRPW